MFEKTGWENWTAKPAIKTRRMWRCYVALFAARNCRFVYGCGSFVSVVCGLLGCHQ